MRHLLFLFALPACADKAADSTIDDTLEPIGWTSQQLRLGDALAPVRGRAWARAIVHLHSPYSHDACDGDGLPDGAVNEPCLQDLRDGLCGSAVDAAFVTDHPSYAAHYDFPELLLARDGDSPSEADGVNYIPCPGGGEITWMPGIEDELMPVALDGHVPGDVDARDALYNRDDADAIAAFRAAGATVLLNHTEGRDLERVLEQQAEGLAGVEMFNLHAMFDPGIREDDLGLDGLGWIEDIAPFLDPDTDAVIDLAFLAVYQEQAPSVAAWDALNAAGAAVGVIGSDAHQNVLPGEAADGERFDSYRRMTRWASNWLLTDGDDAADYEAALSGGRAFVVFEVLGTPDALDVHLEADGQVYEIGQDAPPGTLRLTCPALHPDFPRGERLPDVAARVLRDGQPFAEGCGDHALTDPGVYRVVFDITPHHLEGFLADQAHLLQTWPWIYSNPIRVR